MRAPTDWPLVTTSNFEKPIATLRSPRGPALQAHDDLSSRCVFDAAGDVEEFSLVNAAKLPDLDDVAIASGEVLENRERGDGEDGAVRQIGRSVRCRRTRARTTRSERVMSSASVRYLTVEASTMLMGSTAERINTMHSYGGARRDPRDPKAHMFRLLTQPF